MLYQYFIITNFFGSRGKIFYFFTYIFYHVLSNILLTMTLLRLVLFQYLKTHIKGVKLFLLLNKFRMHYSFKSTPTWTMKGRPQTASNGYPGPADYNVKKPLHRSGSVSAVTQSRNLFKNFQPFPGPGSYQSKSYVTDGPKRSMSARPSDYMKRTPGPHEYDNDTLKVKNKAPNFSMSTKSKSYHQLTFDKNIYSPAPSSYNHKGAFDKNTKVVIGTSQRKDLTETEKTPAPNYYNSGQAGDYASNKNPRCTIGSQFRKTTDFMKVENTPGPAQYDKMNLFDKNKQKKRGYSCRNKTADLIAMEMSKFPGPGQYNSSLVNKSTAPRYAGTNTQRKTFMDDMQDFKKPYPGPGHHNPGLDSRHRSTSAFDFGRSTRRPLDQNQNTPGPVGYNNDKLGVMNSAPKFSVTKTIAKNQFLAVNPESPGPGYYDPSLSLVKSSSQQHYVGRQMRPGFDKHKYTPGPGYYNLRGKSSQGNGWTFKKQLRIAFTDHKSDAKHGNQYNIPEKVVDPPKYMNVQSKIKYDSPIKSAYSTIHSAGRTR